MPKNCGSNEYGGVFFRIRNSHFDEPHNAHAISGSSERPIQMKIVPLV